MGDPRSESKPERLLVTDLAQLSREAGSGPQHANNLDLDVLIVGAGFGGVYSLHQCRKQGLKTVLYDAGTSYGGTWRANCYPGARVDSPVPIYELSIPEVYQSWHWSTNYPEWQEIQRYFDHVDKVLDLRKDTSFSTVVISAEFNESEAKWTVKTQDGRTTKARYFIVAAGFAAKRYIPGYESLDKFQGEIHHSSFWPAEGIDYKGKRVAIIGTGASGVQMVQEMGPVAAHVDMYQRTPNLALPMGRRAMTKEEQDGLKAFYPKIHAYRERCFAGFDYDLYERNTFDDTPEEREAYFEKIWAQKGFSLWLAGYKDYLFDAKANREAYNFWRKKQSVRVKNPEKNKLLFPEEPPHPFGVKRPCLEQCFYEVLDRDNVGIIDINERDGNPIAKFTEKGIVTKDGVEREYDIIGLATGFDVVTGGLTNMGLKSINGTTLQEEWAHGAHTYLGTTISGYPNLFHLYGPHGPTLLSNGPTSVEIQVRWICDAIKQAERQHVKYLNPTKEASDAWKQRIQDLAAPSLFVTTRSTYMGSSIPGKKFEAVCYHGGCGGYADEIREKLQGWQGFEVTPKEGVKA